MTDSNGDNCSAVRAVATLLVLILLLSVLYFGGILSRKNKFAPSDTEINARIPSTK